MLIVFEYGQRRLSFQILEDNKVLLEIQIVPRCTCTYPMMRWLDRSLFSVPRYLLSFEKHFATSTKTTLFLWLFARNGTLRRKERNKSPYVLITVLVSLVRQRIHLYRLLHHTYHIVWYMHVTNATHACHTRVERVDDLCRSGP